MEIRHHVWPVFQQAKLKKKYRKAKKITLSRFLGSGLRFKSKFGAYSRPHPGFCLKGCIWVRERRRGLFTKNTQKTFVSIHFYYFFMSRTEKILTFEIFRCTSKNSIQTSKLFKFYLEIVQQYCFGSCFSSFFSALQNSGYCSWIIFFVRSRL